MEEQKNKREMNDERLKIMQTVDLDRVAEGRCIDGRSKFVQDEIKPFLTTSSHLVCENRASIWVPIPFRDALLGSERGISRFPLVVCRLFLGFWPAAPTAPIVQMFSVKKLFPTRACCQPPGGGAHQWSRAFFFFLLQSCCSLNPRRQFQVRSCVSFSVRTTMADCAHRTDSIRWHSVSPPQ